jgi:hypothetical protein
MAVQSLAPSSPDAVAARIDGAIGEDADPAGVVALLL